MRKHRNILSGILLLTLFGSTFFGLQTVSSFTTFECTTPTITLKVTQGYYGDLDGDGFADDVFSSVDANLSCAKRYNFIYKVTLTLPSGISFSDSLGINTRLNHLIFSTIFFNSAIESGFYTVKAEALLNTGGQFYHTDSLTFDPPGGHSGTGTSSITSVTY